MHARPQRNEDDPHRLQRGISLAVHMAIHSLWHVVYSKCAVYGLDSEICQRVYYTKMARISQPKYKMKLNLCEPLMKRETGTAGKVTESACQQDITIGYTISPTCNPCDFHTSF